MEIEQDLPSRHRPIKVMRHSVLLSFVLLCVTVVQSLPLTVKVLPRHAATEQAKHERLHRRSALSVSFTGLLVLAASALGFSAFDRHVLSGAGPKRPHVRNLDQLRVLFPKERDYELALICIEDEVSTVLFCTLNTLEEAKMLFSPGATLAVAIFITFLVIFLVEKSTRCLLTFVIVKSPF